MDKGEYRYIELQKIRVKIWKTVKFDLLVCVYRKMGRDFMYAIMLLWLSVFYFVCCVFSWIVWTPPTTRDSVCFLAVHQLSPAMPPTPVSTHGKLVLQEMAIKLVPLFRSLHLFINRIVTMEFYGKNDLCLGVFLERYCFRWDKIT